jgi:hypothetical protein
LGEAKRRPLRNISNKLAEQQASVSRRTTRGATSHGVSKSSSGFIQLLPFLATHGKEMLASVSRQTQPFG